MREEFLQIIDDVFRNYAEFSILETCVEDALIIVNFDYKSYHLNLSISNPENVYLRSIKVSIEDRVADGLKIPAHFMRYDDNEKRSSLCLLDKEQHVLSACSLSELIDLYLGQTQSLLSLSRRQKEAEYLREFEFYWNAASIAANNADNHAEVYLPASETATLLSCWYTKDNGKGKYVLFPEGTTINSCNKPKGSTSSAIYIPIEFPNGIIPPQGDIPWNAHDLLDIVCNQTKDRISTESYALLKDLEIDNYKKVVVFSFTQPESVTISVAGVVSFSSNKKKSFISKIQEDFVSFVPIMSSRMDLKYLHERVGQSHAPLPSILLIGCGSVGSYLLPELVNLGFVDIGISDPDTFMSGNSLRHYLGPRSNNRNKAGELKFFMEYENPLVSIDVVPNLLNLKEDDLAEILAKYQIIVLAVGGTDLQKKFNYLFSKLNCKAWFIYNWLDAEGKGSHALAMRYLQKGCYNCLFYDNGEPTSKNKVSFADGSERVIGNGCGGAFSPYGNNVLVRNNTLLLSVLQGILDSSITQNTVVSVGNDFSSIESSIMMVPVIDNNFAEERCDICGHV